MASEAMSFLSEDGRGITGRIGEVRADGGSVRRTRRGRVFAGLVLAVTTLLFVSACGSRVPHSDIVQAAGTASGGNGSGSSGGSGTGSVTGDVGGGATQDGGSAAIGGAVPSAPGAAATQGGGLAAAGSGDSGSLTGGTGGAGGGPGTAAGPGQQAGTPGGPAEVNRPAGGAPIPVGNITTIGGIVGAVVGGARPGAQLWAKSVNARGGLNGHQVNLFTADDAGSPSRAITAVRQLVENNHVAVFVGNGTVVSTPSYEPYLRQKGVPAIGGGDGIYRLNYTSPIFFPVAQSLDANFIQALRIAKETRNITKFAFFSCTDVAICPEMKGILIDRHGFAKAGLGEPAAIFSGTLAQPSFSSECARMKSAGAQAIVMIMELNSVSRLARDCKLQVPNLQLIVPALAAVAAAANDPNLDGAIGATPVAPFFLKDGNAGLREWADALRRYSPNAELSGFMMQAWMDGKGLERASRNLPANPTAADVLKGLWSIKNDNLDGMLAAPATFTEGKAPTEVRCGFHFQIRGGKFVAPDGVRVTHCPNNGFI